LKLADLAYNKMGNYEMAAAYYDSTASLLPQTDPAYKRVVDKQRSLRDFVTQTTIVKTEDSLQRLAKMNPAQLDKVLERVVLDKIAKEAEDLRKAQEIVNRGLQQQAEKNKEAFADPNKSTWYFTNAIAQQQGKTTFSNIWGPRQLEDNWRRSRKDNALTFDNPAANNQGNGLNLKNLSIPTEKFGSGIQADVAELKTKIPFSKEAFEASVKRKEDASFELGKIYKFKLNEPKNAISTLDKFVADFPKSSHEPEALYLLALLNEENVAMRETYRKRLMKDYEDSYFARLLNRTSSETLSTGKESESQKLYAEAYEYYSQNNFTDALTFVETGLKQYPNSQIEDKIVFLKAMILAKTQTLDVYQKALKSFITDYPKSQLISMAKERLEAMGDKK
jgi:outer membrane protein assembly factor BamD (BamD/ComL family)